MRREVFTSCLGVVALRWGSRADNDCNTGVSHHMGNQLMMN